MTSDQARHRRAEPSSLLHARPCRRQRRGPGLGKPAPQRFAMASLLSSWRAAARRRASVGEASRYTRAARRGHQLLLDGVQVRWIRCSAAAERWRRRESNPSDLDVDSTRNAVDRPEAEATAETGGDGTRRPKPERTTVGDAVDTALAAALTKATAAERWDVVVQLARELEARRLARGENVVVLPRRRRDGGER